jgi:hypothetical protein
MPETLRRTIFPEVTVLDEPKGIVEYVASDQTLDRDGEVILAKGWRFTHFQRNGPFVDSHEYHSIEKLLGKVLDFVVKGDRLVETVQWAIDVPENRLAQLGWKMTAAGFLKAVSVGMIPLKVMTASAKDWANQVTTLGLKGAKALKKIFVEQEQTELSAVIIGVNPNALMTVAKGYQAAVLSDADLQFLSEEYAKRGNAGAAVGPDAAASALHRAREEFLGRFEKTVKSIKTKN